MGSVCYLCGVFRFLIKTTHSATMFRTTIIYLAVLIAGTATLSAQTAPKYGHMNLGNLLETLPETKKANDDLKMVADKLAAKDDSLTKDFSAKYAQLEKDYADGNVPPVKLEERKVALQKMQEDIQKFEQDAQQTINTKRDEMLKPILTKINDAVKAVAKENGYLMVFDTSSGVMLFAADADDVTALVKKKLGL
jgi:outer membrane protein